MPGQTNKQKNKQKKRPKQSSEEKRPIELTDDEAIERLFSKEVRDKLREIAEKDDRNRDK